MDIADRAGQQAVEEYRTRVMEGRIGTAQTEDDTNREEMRIYERAYFRMLGQLEDAAEEIREPERARRVGEERDTNLVVASLDLPQTIMGYVPQGNITTPVSQASLVNDPRTRIQSNGVLSRLRGRRRVAPGLPPMAEVSLYIPQMENDSPTQITGAQAIPRARAGGITRVYDL